MLHTPNIGDELTAKGVSSGKRWEHSPSPADIALTAGQTPQGEPGGRDARPCDAEVGDGDVPVAGVELSLAVHVVVGRRRCGLPPSEQAPHSPPHGHHRADTPAAQLPACLVPASRRPARLGRWRRASY